MSTFERSLDAEQGSRPIYKVYKRRFWGLAQLVLLNIVVSWDWLTFSSISTTAADIVIWILNKGGPKPAIITTATLLLVGNWLRYAGTRANGGIFGLAMFGQILIGFAQPFCLCAPTRYSELWFSDKGRTSATAVASLANPLGAALGQLIDSEWASKPSDIPNMVLYISIISTVAAIPSFFLPASPPTPASASSAKPHTPLGAAVRELTSTREFWQIFVPFAVYVGFFNSVSSLLNQILSPHGFSETEAGIAGAILIVVGLVTSAIMSPITDRYKHYLGSIRVLVPVVAVTYIGLIFAPGSAAGIPPSYVVMALLGAASFAMLPIALRIGSTICWTGGQLLGACFILIQDALKAGAGASPPYNMQNALVFAAVVAVAAAPFPLTIGLFGRDVHRRRWEVDRGIELQEVGEVAPTDDNVKRVRSDESAVDTDTLIKT
ncbi:Major facilitator superfamily domain general substrate transporter [Penicillium expansum]|nr:Major facilitator superfamily domain general substrate transporter [Penicillium expansum]